MIFGDFFSPRVVRTTIFLEPENCVPLFLYCFRGPNLCVPLCLQCVYLFFWQILSEMHENQWFPVDFVKISPWIFPYGFQSYSLCNFSFFGPGCGPPHKRASNEHFLEEFAIGTIKGNFLEQTAGTQHSGSRKTRYARFRLEKNSTRIVRTTILVMFGKA